MSEKTNSTADAMMKDYIIGFILAVVLTVIPFAMVMSKSFSTPTVLTVIAICAAVQMVAQLRYFLHLSFTGDMRQNTLALCLTAILVFLMVGGSFWVMYDLHNRMMVM